MKNIKNLTYLFLMIILSLSSYKSQSQTPAPLVINSNPVQQSCQLGSFGTAQVSVPKEALTGDNILLNITLPATSNGCTKNVKIVTSQNLTFVSSVLPFIPAGNNTFENAAVFDPINGQNFNVIFKFPGGTTCDGVLGTFKVQFEVDCNGVKTLCSTDVSVRARAANYWSITKSFMSGNLVCGESSWRFRLNHNNPNGVGLGAYNVSGTITETSNLPYSPNGPISVIGSHLQATNNINQYIVTLKNCLPSGSIITNTANYNLNLGSANSPCGTMNGTLSANSPTLSSPNANISLQKYAYANGGIFSQGCSGIYTIKISNNGNVPWTNFTLTDNLSIPGIQVTGLNLYNGWLSNANSTFTGLTTFTNPGFVLNPGEETSISIYFNITGASGTTVSNTANLSYSAPGNSAGSGSGPLAGGCPGINCPVIDNSILNTSIVRNFNIVAAQAVPSIMKCNVPNMAVPIKQVGNKIKFRIQVGNSGAAPLSTVVNDALGAPQNLSIDASTLTYSFYTNQNSNYCGMGMQGSQAPGNQYVTFNNNLTNPAFNINSLPGNCNVYKSNILVIEFEADILPQLSGSKTNKAVMGNLTSQANYSIDKTAELKIRKTADATSVENGGSFNFIITVTNMGSTPLNTVNVVDNLPDCVERNGNIVVRKGGNIATSSVSGNLNIAVNASAAINPGESFIITVPVRKVSGSSCCNPLATATAKMVPDGTVIHATTPLDEPACVTSTLCCDIPDFNASLTPSWQLGRFNLNLNTGSIPIQELEVSMLDYHVEYSRNECKPQSLGIFGNLFSPNTNIGGLLNQNNGSQSINWGLGSPAQINSPIRLFVSLPSIVNLNCCDGTMYFCLKVRVKTADCKVCEKIICGRTALKYHKIVMDWPQFKSTPNIKPELEGSLKLFEEKQTQVQEIEAEMYRQNVEYALKELSPQEVQKLHNDIGNAKNSGLFVPLPIEKEANRIISEKEASKIPEKIIRKKN